MPESNVIRAFLQQATAQGSRSTVLRPLFGMMAICAAATLSTIYFSAPVWLTYLFSVFCSITMALYLGAYIYCLFNDRDALRSETYSIQKMALEKGIIGDDISGLINLDNSGERRIIEHEASSGEEDKR